VFVHLVGRVLAVVVFASSLSACSGGAAVTPSSSAATLTSGPGALGATRQKKALIMSQPSSTSDCGTCSCSGTADNSTPTTDQNAPCEGVPSAAIDPSQVNGPIIDNGPYAWRQPQQPDCISDPTLAGCQVAVVPGVPSGKCQQTDGADSLAVGTTLGSVNKNGTVTVRSVIDINQVNALASQTIVNNSTVANNWVAVGWIYLDNNGGLWFQKDPLSQWTVAFNANINAYFGISVTPPSAQNPVYIPNPPTVAPIANNLQTVKCFSKGRALVPGTLGLPTVPSA
jgi:hypothetical protein